MCHPRSILLTQRDNPLADPIWLARYVEDSEALLVTYPVYVTRSTKWKLTSEIIVAGTNNFLNAEGHDVA
jgi:hypothetical protein